MAYATTSRPAYLAFQGLMIAAGGFFLFCLIICWVFGREFADGTLQDMLAVPVARVSIVLAELVVAAAWSAALGVLTFITGLFTGVVMGLPQASANTRRWRSRASRA